MTTYIIIFCNARIRLLLIFKFCYFLVEGVHDDVQDEAVSAKKHPAVRYFEILSKLRKKKWDKFERLNKKPKTNFKMNNLEAARRRYKKMEVDEEENVSDEEPMETIDYDKLHLAFDQEKTPKFIF